MEYCNDIAGKFHWTGDRDETTAVGINNLQRRTLKSEHTASVNTATDYWSESVSHLSPEERL